MTGRPRDPRNADPEPIDTDPSVRALERYAELTAGENPHGLADRVMASVADEPTPRRGLLASLFGPTAMGGGAPRFLLVGATMALAVLAVMLAGRLASLFPDEQIGPSPSPSVIVLPSVRPSVSEPPSVSPSPSPTPSEEPTRTPRATRSPRPSPAGTTAPSPSPTDDDDRETPEPDETPEPSEEDHSGPGGEDDEEAATAEHGAGGP
jgi:hypothetical protein